MSYIILDLGTILNESYLARMGLLLKLYSMPFPEGTPENEQLFNQVKEFDRIQFLGQQNYNLEEAFPPLPYHQVISAGILIIDNKFRMTFKSKTVGLNIEGEKDLINYIAEIIKENSNPLLITFNGYHFDLPLLLLKMTEYNIPVPEVYANYSHRFTPNHVDLKERMGLYNQARIGTLNELSKMFRFPGNRNEEDSGWDIQKMYGFGADSLKSIEERVEWNILNTAMIYLRFSAQSGHTDPKNLEIYLESFKAQLRREIKNDRSKKYFQEFLDKLEVYSKM